MSRKIEKAIEFAKRKHATHLDDDGLSFFDSHCKVVAEILSRVTDDEDILAAGYLHDTIEDTDTTFEELEKEFGKTVADLVHEVTHEGTKDSHGFYFPRLKTRDGITIKLADRLSNVSRMDSWSEKRKAHYLKKTKFWKSK